MASNGDWGLLVAEDEEAASIWDGYELLPEPGENAVLDEFVARKGITIRALHKLGTRLAPAAEFDRLLPSDPLAFVYPGGIKYRVMETGERWARFGSTFDRLKIVRHGIENCITVIVAEGETDAAWLSDHYAVDVAVLPAGARTIRPEFLQQLGAYARVLVATDDDESGEEGWQKIKAGLPYAERFAPPGGCKDWCEAGDTVPELPEPSATGFERIGNLIFTDLGPAFRGELPEPEVLVDDLLYDQGVHMLSGHPGAGKSVLAMHIAWLVMVEGRHVIWLDYEQGARMTGQRFREMGVPGDLIDERLHWAWYQRKVVDELPAVAAAYPGALIVLDSMSKVLSTSEIDEYSNPEVLAWTVKVIEFAKTHQLPVLILDHVTKDDKNSDYARGAGTKQADVDVHWKITKLEEFNREQVGLVEMSLHKDRDAYLPLRLYFRIGDGQGGLSVEPTDGPDSLGEEGPPI